MLFDNLEFETELDGVKLTVKEHQVSDTQVFHVVFSDGRKPLLVSKASTAAGTMWMSIPEGRQKEALAIGAKIAEYFKKK